MSIEKILERIAVALEMIASQKGGAQSAPPAYQESLDQAPPPPPTEQANLDAMRNEAPPPPPNETQVVPSQPPALRTPEEMNTILVNEFKRIGDRKPIDDAMRSLGFAGVSNLRPDQQQQLIDTVGMIASA